VTYGQSLNGTNYKAELNYPAATLTPSGSLRVFGDEPYQPVRFFFSQDNGRINHGFYEALAPSLFARRRTYKRLLISCLVCVRHNVCALLVLVLRILFGASHNTYPV
jgi:hypothetical protein